MPGGKPTTYPARFRGYGWIHGYDRAPAFCTLRCALDFAANMVRNGMRLKGLDGGCRDGKEDSSLKQE